MLSFLLAAALHSTQGAFAGPPACFASLPRRAVGTIVLEAQDAEPAPLLQTYNDAEKRGMELFQAGEHERAIRMFELAQVCPRRPRAAARSKSRRSRSCAAFLARVSCDVAADAAGRRR